MGGKGEGSDAGVNKCCHVMWHHGYCIACQSYVLSGFQNSAASGKKRTRKMYDAINCLNNADRLDTDEPVRSQLSLNQRVVINF